jgi:hypothetical protein
MAGGGKLIVICTLILLAAFTAGITGGGIYQGVTQGGPTSGIFVVNRFTGTVTFQAVAAP